MRTYFQYMLKLSKSGVIFCFPITFHIGFSNNNEKNVDHMQLSNGNNSILLILLFKEATLSNKNFFMQKIISDLPFAFLFRNETTFKCPPIAHSPNNHIHLKTRNNSFHLFRSSFCSVHLQRVS